MQRSLRGVLEPAECSCFVGRAAGGDDEVGGGLEQLADDLEANAAGGTAEDVNVSDVGGGGR